MKKFALLLALLLPLICIHADDLTGKRFYINPGHGSFGPNDRPMATIPFPNLKTTGMPDTCGFYESNTNLWKCLYLRDKLTAAGATVLMSRTKSGPWPYTKVNGDYPDYTTEGYKKLQDYEKYNRALSEICEEVEANNIDYFISVHSNAATDGSTTNYPLILYRGADDYSSAQKPKEYVEGSYEKAAAIWPHRIQMMTSGIDPASHYTTSTNIRGDWSFYGSHSVATRSNKKQYDGYLGALKHGASGYLVEGYFHTYQPARHRALNPDYCHQEGLAYYRGIVDYYKATPETTGYIMGTVKDLYNKITNPLFAYAAKSNDQWMPCNGATVILKKAGTEVARYEVDTCFNGLFVFEGLTPGDDYSLDATCPGFKDLGEDFKKAFSVKANETTYPIIFLVDTSYVPPTVEYKNYPDPVQPAYATLAGEYVFQTSFADKALPDTLTGKTIRRVLQRDGMLIVLAVDDKNQPTLVEIDPATQQVVNALPTDFCSVSTSGKMPLGDIALTADGYLIGCNFEQVTFDPTNLWYIYKWEKNAAGWNGATWINTNNNETAGNFFNAYTGRTLTYSGTLADGVIVTTATTTGSTTNTRLVMYYISDGKYSAALRNKPEDASRALTTIDYGENMRLVVSPRDNSSFILFSDKKEPYEWKISTTTNTAPKFQGTLPFYTTGANFFKYAKRSVMAAPTFNADKAITGVALYDISEGFDKAELIKSNTELTPDTIQQAGFAFATVQDMDISLLLTRGANVSKFTTMGVQQPTVAHIMAFGLNVEDKGETYDFTFVANEEGAGDVVFFQDGEEAGRIAIESVKKDTNIVSIAKCDLPGEEGDLFTWGIELVGANVANVGLLHSITPALKIIAGGTRFCGTVDNAPESPAFGSIYLFNREGGNKLTSHTYRNGIVRMKPNYEVISTNVELGGQDFYGSPARMAVDEAGFVFAADWGDPHSGIYVIDPANPTVHTPFFKGTQNTSSGIWHNTSGTAIGSSSPGCHIYGTGAETKLIVYNEDAEGTLPANGVCIYQIGKEDGTIARSWDVAPTKCYTLTGQANTEGNVWGTAHGFFVSQNRSKGNNNMSATALKFYDWDGNEQFNSADDTYKDIIDGCANSAFAVSKDEKRLVMTNGSTEFLVFDIKWNDDKPVLTLNYSFKHGIVAIRQMNFDFAGNLICAGDYGFHVYTLPCDKNITLVPARKALTVEKKNPSTSVTTIEQDRLHNGITYDLLGRPVDASYKGIVIRNGKKYLQ